MMKMMKLLSRKKFLATVFVQLTYWLWLNAAGLEGGHIIRGVETQKIEVSRDQLQTQVVGNELKEIPATYEMLSIEGIFALELLNDPEVIADASNPLQFTIIVPDAFVDTDAIPRRLTFPNSNFLKTVVLDEQIRQDASGQIVSQTSLIFEMRKKAVVLSEPDRNSVSALFFLIRDEAQPIEEESQELANVETEGQGEELTPPEVQVFRNSQKILLHPVSAMMLFQRPTTARVSILNASPLPDGAHRLAVLLDRYHHTSFQEQVKMKLKIVNISSARKKVSLEKTKIYFRPNYMSAALALAQMIPGEQIVERMSLEDMGRIGIDVDIYVGENFK